MSIEHPDLSRFTPEQLCVLLAWADGLTKDKLSQLLTGYSLDDAQRERLSEKAPKGDATV